MMTGVVDLLADLVAHATESRLSNLELIDQYAQRATSAGAAVDVVPGETGRANLHLRFGPAHSTQAGQQCGYCLGRPRSSHSCLEIVLPPCQVASDCFWPLGCQRVSTPFNWPLT